MPALTLALLGPPQVSRRYLRAAWLGPGTSGPDDQAVGALTLEA